MYIYIYISISIYYYVILCVYIYKYVYTQSIVITICFLIKGPCSIATFNYQRDDERMGLIDSPVEYVPVVSFAQKPCGWKTIEMRKIRIWHICWLYTSTIIYISDYLGCSMTFCLVTRLYKAFLPSPWMSQVGFVCLKFCAIAAKMNAIPDADRVCPIRYGGPQNPTVFNSFPTWMSMLGYTPFLDHLNQSHIRHGQTPCWLVVWNMFYFPIYWEYSSQLTNIFQRGSNHQPACLDDFLTTVWSNRIDLPQQLTPGTDGRGGNRAGSLPEDLGKAGDWDQISWYNYIVIPK